MSEELPVPPRDISLVLDRTAITAWVRGSIAVGELLAEIDAEHGAVLVPFPCLVETAALIPDGQHWLDLLLANPTTYVVDAAPEDWRMVAGIHSMLGDYVHAVTAWLALDAGVDVMTRRPDAYAGLRGGVRLLPFDD